MAPEREPEEVREVPEQREPEGPPGPELRQPPAQPEQRVVAPAPAVQPEQPAAAGKQEVSAQRGEEEPRRITRRELLIWSGRLTGGALVAGAAGGTIAGAIISLLDRGDINVDVSSKQEQSQSQEQKNTGGDQSPGNAAPETESQPGDGSRITPAEKKNGQWILETPDGEERRLSLPQGFTPDENLRVNEEVRLLPIPKDTSPFADFQKALNTTQPDGTPPLAGYLYGYNDWCPVPGNRCERQAPSYAWTVFTGEKAEIPGVGKLEGGPGLAVMVMYLNRDETVRAWDDPNSIRLVHGFTASGRIWNGQNNIDKLEQGLVTHFADRLFQGDPATGFTGQCDRPDNCLQVLVVSVDRIQWGFNPDGSKRFVDRLIRAEILTK